MAQTTQAELESQSSASSSSFSSSSSSSSSPNPTFFQIWLATLPMLTITVVAIAANGTVLTMFASRQGLRRCKNVYIASLAIADFLVSLCMPIKLSLDLHQGWVDGWPCRVYQIVRQSAMYISFLSIFLITLDKWRAMHYPISYRNKSTKRLAITAVVVIWILGFLVYSLPLVWWPNVAISSPQKFTKLKSSPVVRTNDLGNVDPTSSAEDAVVGPRIFSDPNTYNDNNNNNNNDKNNNNENSNNNIFIPHDFCPEGYHLKFNLSVLSTTFFYIIPILCMLVFDISLYLKIKWRKSVEVQRSTSVTDTYFMTLKKPALDMDSCVTGADDPAKESLLKTPDSKPVNKHLVAVAARGERRHSSLPAISPIIKGRTSSGRRVSMPEGNAAGGCRYVGRKWSGCTTAMSGNTSPNPMANLGPRIHEDMVHDILVKQDKKIARCLCFLLALMIVCWLPHTVVSSVNANCWCVDTVTLTATSWLNLLSHALNPVLYVLMNAQFKNVLKQWLLIERVHVFKMRDTLILKHLQRKVVQEDDESNSKDKSPNPSAKSEHFHLPTIDKAENSSV